ncbi:MAG: hypothetical protein HFE90_04995 [Firmicutes bacterium]|nr:hypothetical protein [Bacillota bacterium]
MFIEKKYYEQNLLLINDILKEVKSAAAEEVKLTADDKIKLKVQHSYRE